MASAPRLKHMTVASMFSKKANGFSQRTIKSRAWVSSKSWVFISWDSLKFRINWTKTCKCLNRSLSVFSNSAPLSWRVNLIYATADPYIIKINITRVPLNFWGLCLNFTELNPVRSLMKVVPDASSHSYFKCPTYSVRELLVTLLLGLAEKQHVRKKNTSQEKWFKVLERRRGE